MRTAFHYASFPMRTLVTGASGFIGRSLCPALSAAGHELVSDIARAEAVIHLAGIAHRRGVDDAELARVNVDLAVQTARATAAGGAHFIFMSSIKVHGEESAAPLTERSPIAPRDAYAQSKARAEDALRAIPGLRLAVLRPPLVYGPAVKANFLALLKAVDRGIPLPFAGIENRRSLVYVGNLANAVMSILRNRTAGAYLVSDGMSLSTPDLCRRLATALGRQSRLFGFPSQLLDWIPAARPLTRSLEVDAAALRAALGWQPPFSLEHGLRATADWYL